MSEYEWERPCKRDDTGAHDFEPLREQKVFFDGNTVKFSICRKCGVAR